MKHDEHTMRFEWCPLTGWVLLYLGAIAVTEWLLRHAVTALGQPWLGYPVVTVSIATLLSAAYLEPRVRRPYLCGWMPQGIGRRILFYVAAFVVGIFFFSGVTPAFGATWVYRAAAILAIVIPTLSLLVAHSATEHSGQVDRPLLAALRIVGRIPLIVGVAAILVLVVLTIADRLLS